MRTGVILFSRTFRLGGQFTFSIDYIHTQSDTTFYVGITKKTLPISRTKTIHRQHLLLRHPTSPAASNAIPLYTYNNTTLHGLFRRRRRPAKIPDEASGPAVASTTTTRPLPRTPPANRR